MRYNFLQAIVMSFYSRDLYRDVQTNWRGYTFLYLLVICLLSSVSSVFTLQHYINRDLPTLTNELLMQVPVITVKKGIAQTPENKPYYLVDTNDKKVFGIIDTTDSIKNLHNTQAEFLVNSNKVTYRHSANEMREYSFPSTTNMTIVPQTIKQAILSWATWIWALLLPIWAIMLFVARFFQCLFYAILGRIYGAFCNIPLDYASIMMLSFVSITPVIVINFVLCLLGASVSWLLTFILAIAYLFFAIRANYPAHAPHNNDKQKELA